MSDTQTKSNLSKIILKSEQEQETVAHSKSTDNDNIQQISPNIQINIDKCEIQMLNGSDVDKKQEEPISPPKSIENQNLCKIYHSTKHLVRPVPSKKLIAFLRTLYGNAQQFEKNGTQSPTNEGSTIPKEENVVAEPNANVEQTFDIEHQEVAKEKNDQEEMVHSISQDNFDQHDIEMIKLSYDGRELQSEPEEIQENSSSSEPFFHVVRSMPIRSQSVCELGSSKLTGLSQLSRFSTFGKPTNHCIDEQEIMKTHNYCLRPQNENVEQIEDFENVDQPTNNGYYADKSYSNFQRKYNSHDENTTDFQEYIDNDYVVNSKKRLSTVDASNISTKQARVSFGSPTFSKSPTPTGVRTPGRPHTPAEPYTSDERFISTRPNTPSTTPSQHEDEHVRLIVYDQNTLSGGICLGFENEVIRAFNLALADAIVQDRYGAYDDLQVYDNVFESNFYTFTVNSRKYIGPLRDIVKNMPELWENCKFRIMTRGESLNFYAVLCEIPIYGGTITFDEFLKILKTQNYDVDIDSWGLIKQLNLKNSIIMVLRMELSTWKMIETKKIYFLSSTLQFRLRGGIETMDGIQNLNEYVVLKNDESVSVEI